MPDDREGTGQALEALVKDAGAYFDRAEGMLGSSPRPEKWDRFERDHFWKELPVDLRSDAANLANRLVAIAGQIASAVRNAPLASEADQRDVMTGTKAMRAALLLREFKSWPPEVLHDEGAVLGVHPAGQSDDEPSPPEVARRRFTDWGDKIQAILELVAASRGLGAAGGEAVPGAPARYRPRTAFIMMSMDKARPELADVAYTVKDVFKQFDVDALRADDIEHEDLVTKKILGEIETAEFLFADLTGERPNVYYEVGYAHALGRRVILYRRAGTGLHFDLAGYNCPEYASLVDLRTKLTGRLEHLTNRRPVTSKTPALPNMPLQPTGKAGG